MREWSLRQVPVRYLNRFAVAFILVLSLSSGCLAAGVFDYIATDKYAHFFTCAYVSKYGQQKGYRDGDIFIGVGTIGLLKEFYDWKFCGKQFDWQDFAADMLGAGLGIVVR